MKVKEAADKFGFETIAGQGGLDNEIGTVYIGDMLSWVMGNATQDCAWLTICGHVNIVAVGLLIECACILVCEDAQIDAGTIEKADKENVPVLRTELTSYEAAKKFAELAL